MRFAERHAEQARALAQVEPDALRRQELECIAQVCTHVPAQAPRDFGDVVDYYGSCIWA